MNNYIPKYSLDVYLDILESAKLAYPTPTQSNFFVHAAGRAEGYSIAIPGGNHEYAINDAEHAEETVISRIEELFPQSKIDIMGFYAKGSQGVPSSCGNCRDRMRGIMSEDAEIVGGSDESNIIIAPFKSLLKEDFTIAKKPVEYYRLYALKKANQAYFKSYDIYSDKNKIYGVSILTSIGIFSGGFEGDVAYDPTLPLRTAALTLKYSSNNPGRFNISEVFIVGGEELLSGKNTIPYKDRQQFLEFAYISGKISGKAARIPITIATGEGKNVRFFRTDSDEWLPHPFHPKVLGIDKELDEYVKRIRI